jgi:clan AA aspartic protease
MTLQTIEWVDDRATLERIFMAFEFRFADGKVRIIFGKIEIKKLILRSSQLCIFEVNY